jgi:hypothetical protein
MGLQTILMKDHNASEGFLELEKKDGRHSEAGRTHSATLLFSKGA